MKHRLWAGAVMLSIVVLLLTSGCAGKLPGGQAAKTGDSYYTLQDDAGRTVILSKKPERVIPLSTSFIDPIYAVGGKAAGKPSSKTGSLPREAQGLPDIGQIANINMEQVIALQPDLVIGYQGLHEKFIPMLESSRTPFVILRMKTVDDVVAKLKLFGEIFDTRDQAQNVADSIKQKIAQITDRLPAGHKKVVILHATTSSITVLLENSIAGNVAQMLRLENIAAGSIPLEGNPEATPYSMEKLLDGDPEMILITFMGDKADVEKSFRASVAGSPAWAGLRAVQNKQVFFLPMELFLLNPGIRYDEAVLYMAKIVYPEIYGSIP